MLIRWEYVDTPPPPCLSVEVLYHQLDRIGVVPEINQPFPCDEAPSGSLFVVEKKPLTLGDRKIGWTIRRRH